MSRWQVGDPAQGYSAFDGLQAAQRAAGELLPKVNFVLLMGYMSYYEWVI